MAAAQVLLGRHERLRVHRTLEALELGPLTFHSSPIVAAALYIHSPLQSVRSASVPTTSAMSRPYESRLLW